MIRFSCHSCGQLMHVGDEAADKIAACPQCGQHVVIPRRSEPRKSAPRPEVIFSSQEEDSDSPIHFETVPPQQSKPTSWRKFNPEPVSDSSAIPLVFERPAPEADVPVLKRKTFPQKSEGKEVRQTTFGNRARWTLVALVVFLLGIFWIFSLRETGSDGSAEARNSALYGEAWEQS